MDAKAYLVAVVGAAAGLSTSRLDARGNDGHIGGHADRSGHNLGLDYGDIGLLSVALAG